MIALLNAGHTNSWDEAGMMKQSVVPTGSASGVEGTNEYGYDATQRRIFKKITRNSSVAEHTVSIHAGPNLIAEYPAGTVAATPSNEFVYAQEIDSLVMLVRSTGGGSGNEKLTITRNQQWSVTALSDASSGSVVERYTFDAFGKRTILEPNGTTVRATSSYNMPFGYTSRQHDLETGLMYFRARYFDPASGEFTSPDPLHYVDGMSLFRGYFVINYVDSLGGVNVDPIADSLAQRNCRVNTEIFQSWRFSIADHHKKLEAGWIVQKVTVTASKNKCQDWKVFPILIVSHEFEIPDELTLDENCNCYCDPDGKEQTFSYWEAWRLPKDKAHPINPDGHGAGAGASDKASFPIGPKGIKDTCGKYKQDGEIRFYTDSDLVMLDDKGKPVTEIIGPPKWSNNNQPWPNRGSEWATSAWNLWATGTKPTFWDQEPVSKGSRSFEVKWRCCDCDPAELRTIKSNADPTLAK